MDIRIYSSFMTVAELANMTAAAQRLNMTQPALSRQIMGLETHLGVKLFEKAGRNIRLTAEGEALVIKVQALLAAERDLKTAAEGMTQGETGLLRVGACSQLIERYFPAFLKGWKVNHPGIDVRLEDAGGAELIERLRGGQVHITVCAAPVQPIESLSMRRIGALRFLAVGTQDFLGASGHPIEASDLFEKPLLVLNRKHASREVFDAVMRVYGARPEIVVESYSPHTLFSLAEGGNGIAIVPSSARIASADLMRRPIMLKGEPISFEICAMWNTLMPPPAYAQRFVEELAAEIGKDEFRDRTSFTEVKLRTR